jgi:hypothetical protein
MLSLKDLQIRGRSAQSRMYSTTFSSAHSRSSSTQKKQQHTSQGNKHSKTQTHIHNCTHNITHSRKFLCVHEMSHATFQRKPSLISLNLCSHQEIQEDSESPRPTTPSLDSIRQILRSSPNPVTDGPQPTCRE